jgi:hypothetical protein
MISCWTKIDHWYTFIRAFALDTCSGRYHCNSPKRLQVWEGLPLLVIELCVRASHILLAS